MQAYQCDVCGAYGRGTAEVGVKILDCFRDADRSVELCPQCAKEFRDLLDNMIKSHKPKTGMLFWDGEFGSK